MSLRVFVGKTGGLALRLTSFYAGASALGVVRGAARMGVVLVDLDVNPAPTARAYPMRVDIFELLRGSSIFAASWREIISSLARSSWRISRSLRISTSHVVTWRSWVYISIELSVPGR